MRPFAFALISFFDWAVAAAQEPGGNSGQDVSQTPLRSLTEDFASMLNQAEENTCDHPPYRQYIVFTSPLVVYIEGFLTVAEQEHLLNITNGTFYRSTVSHPDGTYGKSTSRTSHSTYPNRTRTLLCIERRAASLQGLTTTLTTPLSLSRMEPPQLVRYEPGAYFKAHTDWFPPYLQDQTGLFSGGNRFSSLFAYVGGSDDLVGGGTNFPGLDSDKLLCGGTRAREWCKFVDCDAPREMGLTFRPLSGNAVFWVNMVDAEDVGEQEYASPRTIGDMRVTHAGLPVTRGWKVGLNLWTRESPTMQEVKVVQLPDGSETKMKAWS